MKSFASRTLISLFLFLGFSKAQAADDFSNWCAKASPTTRTALLKVLAAPDCKVPESVLQKVTTLDLHGANLSDVSFVRFMPNLLHIDLSHNVIDNITPLVEHASVRTMNLDSNKVSSIPNIPAHSKLEQLSLRNNFLLILQGNFPSLSILDVTANSIQAIHSVNAPRLVSLNLSYNYLREIDNSNSFPMVKQLNLTHNQLQELCSLRIFSELRWLTLSDNAISLTPCGLELLPKLQSIQLARNGMSSFPFLQSQSKHLSLRELNLKGNRLFTH